MSSPIRYEPWSLHRDLINEVNRFFERSVNADPSSSATAEWMPAVDIEERADSFVLYADLPGIDPKAIDITLERGMLTLSGSRERKVEQEGVQSRRNERASGRFLRQFSLPDTADGEGVTAKGNNGVLEIVIPKHPAAKPRRIEVRH